MGVEFLTLEEVQLSLTVDGAVYIGGNAGATVVAVGQSEADGAVFVSGEAEVDVLTEVIVPEIPPHTDGSVYVSGEAEMASGTGLDVDGEVFVSGESLPSGAVDGTVYISGDANSEFEFNGYYIFATEVPEVVSSYVGMSFAALNDEVRLQMDPEPLQILVLREIAALREIRLGRYQGTASVLELIELRERLQYVIQLAIAEGLSLDASPAPSFTAVARVVNRLLLVGAVRHEAEATRLLVDALTMTMALDSLPTVDVSETVALSDLVSALHTAVAQAIERIIMEGAVGASHQLTLLLRESVALSGTAVTEVELVAALREAVGFAMTLSFDDGLYTAWVLNTESAGLSTYSNFPFNSFAKIGGRYYGLHTGGIVRLGGDTDDGAPIAAKLRFGLFDFNDRHLKAFSEVYVGSSGGQLLLKVIWADDATGEKRGAIYRMKHRPAAAIREARFEPGKGLKAVDWDFELENVDGADFDLHTIQFQPMALSRRTRG